MGLQGGGYRRRRGDIGPRPVRLRGGGAPVKRALPIRRFGDAARVGRGVHRGGRRITDAQASPEN